MEHAILESRPLYGIGTVARLTGLKPDTLRVWERRYGLGASRKSATGRRQFTQSDLEHLQLVAALVESGVRIGEIAAAERKTLEMLLRVHSKAEAAIPESKPRAVFIGEALCEWLDEHQGCLAHVDAKLARIALNACETTLLDDEAPVDMLVIECDKLGSAQASRIRHLASATNAGRVLVTYGVCNERWLKELEQGDIIATAFPPEPGFLAGQLARSAVGKATRLGDASLGELVPARPRQFSERDLSVARTLPGKLDCECSRHITDLIRALADFEDHANSCSVSDWPDVAVQSCIYAYTVQSRWLMEKALQAALEERGAQHASPLKENGRGRLDDAA